VTFDQTAAKDSLRDIFRDRDGLTTRFAARDVFSPPRRRPALVFAWVGRRIAV